MKFCGHRWLENVGVAERAIALLPALRNYVDNVQVKPKNHSFSLIAEDLKDAFLVRI